MSQTIAPKDATCAGFGEKLNLGLAVEQHLSSLQDFGISVVPKGQGEAFQFAEPEPENASLQAEVKASNEVRAADSIRSVAASVSPSVTAKPGRSPNVVREAAPVAANPSPNVGLDSPYAASVPAADRSARLSIIQSEVAACTRCPQLSEYRTNTVFGVGDPNSRLVFVGEGPGEQEDRDGEPFVGAAGQLLDKILGACGLKREQVYILNTVKCRPPQNRNPKPDELSNCWSYGQRQLDILQPEFICCLGSVAAKTVLNTNLSVGKLRKRFHQYRGSKVLVTYHPAYLLRTSSAKIHAWNDMKMLMKEMGIEIPSGPSKN